MLCTRSGIYAQRIILYAYNSGDYSSMFQAPQFGTVPESSLATCRGQAFPTKFMDVFGIFPAECLENLIRLAMITSNIRISLLKPQKFRFH